MIESLEIFEQNPEYKLIRKISFRSGMNLVVDQTSVESEENQKGNGVGKTTMLRLIDLCLGASERQRIYRVEGTKAEIIDLKNYIENCSLRVKLVLCENQKKLELEVDLFNNGGYFINGERYGVQKYGKKLKEEIFKASGDENPTFRQLIPKFVRISLSGDSKSGIFKYLDYSGTPNEVYRMCYKFLLGIHGTKESNRISETKKLLKIEEDYFKRYKKEHHVSTIKDLEQKIENRERFLEQAENRLNTIIDSHDYKEKVDEISKIRDKYTMICDELDEYIFKKEQINEMEFNSLREPKLDQEILEKLYSDVSNNFSINKTFDDLVRFNQKLDDNKLKFYREQREKILETETKLRAEKDEWYVKYGDMMALVSSEQLSQYKEIQKEVFTLNDEITELRSNKVQIQKISDSIDKLQKEIEMLEKVAPDDPAEEKEKIEYLKSLFAVNSSKICDEKLSFVFKETDFPLSLDKVKTGYGTGGTKSRQAAFDLSYLQYTHHYKIPSPDFIVSDVWETVDERTFRELVLIVENMPKCQYIMAVLNEKIERYSFITDEMKRLELSENDKLFKLP